MLSCINKGGKKKMRSKSKWLYLLSLLMVMLVGCNGAEDDMSQGALSDDGMISAAATDQTSKEFPHTKAICIEPAKYEYVVEKGTQPKQGGDVRKPQNGGGTPEPPADTNQVPTTDNRAAGPEMATREEAAPQTQAPTTGGREERTAPKETTPEPARTENAPQTVSAAERKVVELTNVERRNNGLPDLQLHAKLSGVARTKSEDMRTSDYFSHTSPTHGSPFDMIRDNGISYQSAGENIARGQQTPEQVVQSWMNSTGHRKNILSSDFTHIGVGYDENGHFWTQMFIKQ